MCVCVCVCVRARILTYTCVEAHSHLHLHSWASRCDATLIAEDHAASEGECRCKSDSTLWLRHERHHQRKCHCRCCHSMVWARHRACADVVRLSLGGKHQRLLVARRRRRRRGRLLARKQSSKHRQTVPALNARLPLKSIVITTKRSRSRVYQKWLVNQFSIETPQITS